MPAEPSVNRLQRILLMVPWVMAHGQPTVAEVCARFGIERDELVADLELLFVCGLPPFGPGDLIEAFVEGDRVVIQMADYLRHPLRLTRAEAVSLLVIGKAMAAVQGLEEAESLRRALVKLEAAVSPAEAGAAQDLAARVVVEWERAPAELLSLLREAISERRRVKMTYYTAGSARVTERRVDPLLVFAATRHWYLVAYDRGAREERVFRVDRIKEASFTGRPFTPPADFDPRKYADGVLFTPSERDVSVTVDVAPEAAWVLEVTPHDASERLEDGWSRMSLRTPHLAWLVHLIFRLGPRARVVGPEELAGRVREAAGRALARYS